MHITIIFHAWLTMHAHAVHYFLGLKENDWGKRKSSRIWEQSKDPLLELLTRFSTGGTHLLYTFTIHSLDRCAWGWYKPFT